MTGVELIAKERKEQIEKHGWSSEHDDQHKEDELIDVVTYILTWDRDYWPDDWEEDQLNKLAGKSYKEQLVVAGALIAAEIDRLNRKDN